MVLGILLQVVVGYNLIVPMVLHLAHIWASKRPVVVNSRKSSSDFAVIVTAYQHTHQLHDVIESILCVDYQDFHIYVVADNCDVTGFIHYFDNPKVSILKPANVLSSNIKSHFYAIDRFIRPHDKLTIIDSDNLVHPQYLKEIDRYFNDGFHAVQGIRKAKNLNNSLACLDAARDFYYNYYDGEVLFSLGSSATLAGSGMAFTTRLYKEILQNCNVKGAGFDKYLQAHLLLRDVRIAHAPDAIVYDEKTVKGTQLVNQRARWINTWFKYVGYAKDVFWQGLRQRSINQLMFGFILFRPPLFLFILISGACLLFNVYVNPAFAFIWAVALSLFICSFFVALKKMKAPLDVYRALFSIPKFIAIQVVSLYYSRVANQRSVATKHPY